MGRAVRGTIDNVAEAPPVRPTPLDQDGLLRLFTADVTGGNVTLLPATQADMRGGTFVAKPSLEVIYDAFERGTRV
jgi:chlorophyllide a reductase subunit X